MKIERIQSATGRDVSRSAFFALAAAEVGAGWKRVLA